MYICFNIFYFFVGEKALWRKDGEEGELISDIKEEAPESDDTDQGHQSDPDTGTGSSSSSEEEEDERRPKAKVAQKPKPTKEVPKRPRKQTTFPSTNQIDAVLYRNQSRASTSRAQNSSREYAESCAGTSNPDEDVNPEPGCSYSQLSPEPGCSYSQLSEQPNQIRMQQMLNRTNTHLPDFGQRGEARTRRDANKRVKANMKKQRLWEQGIRPEDDELEKKKRSSSRPPQRASSQQCSQNINNYGIFGSYITADSGKGCIFCTRNIVCPRLKIFKIYKCFQFS